MPQFDYTARTADGQRVTGTLEAASRREALAALSGRALFPLEVGGSQSAETTPRIGRVPAHLMATTMSQLADLLKAGVPLLKSLEVLRRQTSHATLREVLTQVCRHIEEGSTLADALGRFPTVFGEMAISMVRAGGEGGFLEEALARVAEFTETQEDLKSRTVGAIAYPCVLAMVFTLIVVGLLLFVVPMFDDLFANLRERNQLPWLTEALLSVSAAAWTVGPWLAAAAVAGGVFLWRWQKTDQGRTTRDRLKLRIPVAGTIFRDLAVARFCRVLGTMLRNGVPILRSLEVSSDAAGNRILATAVRKASETVSAGKTLSGPLAACGHFPTVVVEMISIAEESNTLDTVLVDIAESLERRTWRRLDLVVRFLEPVLLLMLAGVVLLLVIAVLLPLFRSAGAM
jgi:general secretion pathway protein F/type IV pilus assembly protein PilC